MRRTARGWRWRLIGGLAMTWLVGGCAHLHPIAVRPPVDVPAETAAYYDYPKATIAPQIERLGDHKDYTVERVRWPFASAAPVEPADAVIEVEWYASRQPGRRAAVLVLPILGGDYPIERAFCRFFAQRGLHCALVHRRTIKFTASESPADLEVLLRRTVIRQRQVIDWLETQPGVDAARVGVFGISMGGIVGVMTAAVEPRVQAVVAGLAGGGIADILRETRDPILAKPRARYLATRGLTLDELHRQLREALRTDPLRLAPYVDGRRVLMIRARLDRTIPAARSRQLWEALGRPERVTLPTGHYSSLLLVPYVETRALRFYRRTLGLSPTSRPRRGE